MNYAKIKHFDIANGPGIRTSVFVSGCSNHCKGCFNPETWDPTYGNKFTNLKDTIGDYDHYDFKNAISISSGLSFREMLQLSKLNINDNLGKEFTFSELYKLETFLFSFVELSPII